MNISVLSDQELLSNTKKLVKEEKNLTLKIIEHLEEVSKRKLYCDLKYQSLFEYCVYELGYSRDEAYRRLDAMKTSKKVPEIKKELGNGTITLSTINLMSDFLNASAKKNITINSREILTQIKGQSKKDVEKFFIKKKEELGIKTQIAKKEIVTKAGEEVRLNITLKKSTMDKITKLKALVSHSNPNFETSDLLDKVLDDAIAKMEAKKFAQRKAREGKVPTKNSLSNNQISDGNSSSAKKLSSSSSSAKISSQNSSCTSRYIPAQVKREVYKNSSKSCANCGSIFFLEYDHQKSFAKGGASDATNMIILCSRCNQRKAIIEYGQLHMDQFLNN